MEGMSVVQKIRQWPVGLKNYVQELQMEMRRVTWPSRKQVRATTLVVWQRYLPSPRIRGGR